jgi:hypothetical protein
MPGFVKTAADESQWAKAKAAAMKQYPDLSEDRQFAAANHIFHSMKGSSKRMERTANPGTPNIVSQYPELSDKSEPFCRLEPQWQPTHLDNSKHIDRYTKDGASNGVSREIPLLGGGTGRVVGSARESDLRRPPIPTVSKSARSAGERGGS